MPENEYEIAIESNVFPDTLAVTIINDEWCGSRDYMSKELGESYRAACDYWREYSERLNDHIRELRDLCKRAHACKVNDGNCEDCYVDEGECPIERDMRKLGVEVPE